MFHLCWGNLNETGETGYKERNVADRKLCQSFPSPLLSSLLQVLPTLGKEEKNSFGTCSEKSLLFPEVNLSVWGILAAALHLHKHHREGAAGVAPPRLTAPFGWLLQEWGPERVLLLGPGFSRCTCNFLCLLITPPLAVALPHPSSGTRLPWAAKAQSGASARSVLMEEVRSGAPRFLLVWCTSRPQRHRGPLCPRPQ